MDKFVITEELEEAVTGHAGDTGPISWTAEASTLGLNKVPQAIEHLGVLYENPKALKDNEGETYAVEYRNGRRTFKIWND